MTPGSTDRALIRRHLAALDMAVTALRRHAGVSIERIESDLEERWIIERGLLLCAQNCIDVATHLAASAGRDVPDYASAIDALGDMGVLPAAFARQFRGIAGFRNVVVHGYLSVDPAIIQRLVSEHLDDFTNFERCVTAHLGE